MEKARSCREAGAGKQGHLPAGWPGTRLPPAATLLAVRTSWAGWGVLGLWQCWRSAAQGNRQVACERRFSPAPARPAPLRGRRQSPCRPAPPRLRCLQTNKKLNGGSGGGCRVGGLLEAGGPTLLVLGCCGGRCVASSAGARSIPIVHARYSQARPAQSSGIIRSTSVGRREQLSTPLSKGVTATVHVHVS